MDVLGKALEVIKPMVTDAGEEAKESQYEITETFLIVGRMIQLIQHDSLGEYIKLLQAMNEAMKKAGKEKYCLALPCVVNAGVSEGTRYLDLGKTEEAKQVFEFVQTLVEDLATADSQRAIKEYLQLVLTLRGVREMSELVEGFVQRVGKLYGGEFELMPMIVGTLREVLIGSEVALSCLAQLAEMAPSLKNPKQEAEAYILLSYVYFKYEPDKVSELLAKARRLMPKDLFSSIRVLNAYFFFARCKQSNAVRTRSL